MNSDAARKPVKASEGNGTPPISIGKRLSLAIAGMLIYILAAIGTIIFVGGNDSALIIDHFPALAGLPMGAVLAFIIVTLLPANYGNIEIQAWGIKLKGASGPIILWLACFIVIAGAAIRLLW
jgi:hypothetical protein